MCGSTIASLRRRGSVYTSESKGLARYFASPSFIPDGVYLSFGHNCLKMVYIKSIVIILSKDIVIFKVVLSEQNVTWLWLLL
jgi:hypothetical protein